MTTIKKSMKKTQKYLKLSIPYYRQGNSLLQGLTEGKPYGTIASAFEAYAEDSRCDYSFQGHCPPLGVFLPFRGVLPF
jgi:hypothetical protein